MNEDFSNINILDLYYFISKKLPDHTKYKFIEWYVVGHDIIIKFESFNHYDRKFTNSIKIFKNEIVKYQRLKKIIKINDSDMQK